MRLTEQDKAAILAFMKRHPMAVIGTNDAKTERPETALIAFAETDDLEIIFETFDVARKYENLKQNPAVALVVGWDLDEHVTLQYEGEAYELADEDADRAKKIMLAKKTPCTEDFLNDPRVKMFKVTPRWIRLSDYTGGCPVNLEGNFSG